MKKHGIYLLIFFIAALSCSGITAFSEEETEENENTNLEFVYECDTVDDFSEMVNVTLYPVPEEAQDAFYDDFTTLQRTDTEDAYVVLSIPYLHTFTVESYYWGGEAIELLEFQISSDGAEWETAVLTSHEIIHTEEGKWTRVLDTVSEIKSGTGYLKIKFPNNPTVWSPIIGKITAKSEERRAVRIEAQNPSVLAIPRFGEKAYTLSAKVMDQMNLPMDLPVIWKLTEEGETPENLKLSEDGHLTVSAETSELTQYGLTVSCPSAALSVSQTFELKKAILGDCNYDFVLDKTDLEFALSFYKAKAETAENWNEIRLVDIDDSGIIDVYDIAYLAKNQMPPHKENDFDEQRKQ